MKNLIAALVVFLTITNAYATNLKLLSSSKEPRLKGAYDYYLDSDSIKQISPGVIDVETLMNLPPLIEQEGSIIKNTSLSEKTYVTINCKTNKAKRKLIESYSEINAKGSIVFKSDLTKIKNDGFVMNSKTSEYLVAKIICQK